MDAYPDLLSNPEIPGNAPLPRALPQAGELLAPMRRIYRVRPTRDAWELSFGDKGDTVMYATRIEAVAAAFGGAWRHWRERHLPAGVLLDGGDKLVARFGALDVPDAIDERPALAA